MKKITKEEFQTISSEDLLNIYDMDQDEYIDFNGKRYEVSSSQNGKRYIEISGPHPLKKGFDFIRETESRIYTFTVESLGKPFDIYDESDCFDRKYLESRQRAYFKVTYKPK